MQHDDENIDLVSVLLIPVFVACIHNSSGPKPNLLTVSRELPLQACHMRSVIVISNGI